MKDELLRLAERCEQADGDDREIDADVCRAIGYEVKHHLGGSTPYYEPRKNYSWQVVPAYTASIDVALSLVPSDMRDEIEITTLYRVARVSINMNHGPDGSSFYGSNECNSIPLAICAAALKARASMEDNGNQPETPSPDVMKVWREARRAWRSGPAIVRDEETNSVRIGDREAAATVIAEAKARWLAEKEAEIARLREALRHSQGRFLNINIALTTNRGKAVNEAIAYADIGEDCIKMALARAALKDKRP